MKFLIALPLLAALASATYNCNAPIAGVADVVLPVSAAFEEANFQYSTLMGDESYLEPDLVANCVDEDEVVSAVKWARYCGYKVSVRSGGHSYAGYSSCGPWFNSSIANGCMVIDVSQLEHYEMNEVAKQATFGVGFVLGEMYQKLDEYDWIVPAGICQTVGVGGHFQTSALGMTTRSFGLGMDHVSSFRMVDSWGQIRVVSEESDEDLFWAVLGGGAGSWGVILDYTFDVLEAADYPNSEVRILNFPYTHDIMVAVTNAWLQIHQSEEVAHDMTSILVVGVPNELWPIGNYTHVISMYSLWTGVDGPFTDAHYDAYIQPLIDAGTSLLQSSWVYLPLPIDTLLSVISVPFNKSPFHYHVAAKLSKQQSHPYFGPDFAELTATMIDDRLTHDDMFLSLQLQAVGSIYNSQYNLNTDKTAYAVRDTVIIIDDWLFFQSPEDSDTAADLVASYMDDLDELYPTPDNSAAKTFMTPRTMDAEVDVMEDEWDKWYPSWGYYNKLRRIKKRVDRFDLFSSAMTVPPKNWPF